MRRMAAPRARISAEGKKTGMKTASGSSRPTGQRTPASYSLPATVSLAECLDGRSDRRFRQLIQDLLTVASRLQIARDYFGRRIDVTGPQYNVLMTVARLQGTTGVGVGSAAQAMHVSSAFVASETGKLSRIGYLKKHPNPQDGRGALLKLSPLGRKKIHRLTAEIRAVNDLFFGLLTARSFGVLCGSAEALVEGSRKAMRYIAEVEEETV
jgi:DNA-binding MarR family transcriptional regulator